MVILQQQILKPAGLVGEGGADNPARFIREAVPRFVHMMDGAVSHMDMPQGAFPFLTMDKNTANPRRICYIQIVDFYAVEIA